MKIIAQHLINVFKSNGPTQYRIKIKVVEVENGNLYEERLTPSGYDYKRWHQYTIEDLKDPFWHEEI